jgi:hypothetical protein
VRNLDPMPIENAAGAARGDAHIRRRKRGRIRKRLAVALIPFRRAWANPWIAVSASAVLLINLQDITTSLSETIWNTLLEDRALLRELSGMATVIENCVRTLADKAPLQWILLLLAVPWGVHYGTRLARGFMALPIPRPALLAIGAVLIFQAAGVALKLEVYPLSPVAMFAVAQDPYTDRYYVRLASDAKRSGIEDFLLETDQGIQPLNLFREGDPIFSGYLDLDMKSAWILRKYSQTSAAREVVDRQLDERGYPPIRPVLLRTDLWSGETEAIPANRPAPRIATSR